MSLLDLARESLVVQLVAILFHLSPWEYEKEISPMFWVTFTIRFCRYVGGILSIFSKVLTLAIIARGSFHNTLSNALWFPTRTSIYIWSADTVITFIIAIVYYFVMVSRQHADWIIEVINMFSFAIDGEIYKGEMYSPPEVPKVAKAFQLYKYLVYHGIQLAFTCSLFL